MDSMQPGVGVPRGVGLLDEPGSALMRGYLLLRMDEKVIGRKETVVQNTPGAGTLQYW